MTESFKLKLRLPDYLIYVETLIHFYIIILFLRLI